jgi:hypothetical protein
MSKGYIEQGYDGVFYPAKLLTNFTKNQISNTYKKRVNNIADGIDFVPRHIAIGLNKVVEAPYHIGKSFYKYVTRNNTSHKENGTKTKNKTVKNTNAVSVGNKTHPTNKPYNWLNKYKNREPFLTPQQINMLKNINKSNNNEIASMNEALKKRSKSKKI